MPDSTFSYQISKKWHFGVVVSPNRYGEFKAVRLGNWMLKEQRDPFGKLASQEWEWAPLPASGDFKH